MRASNAKYAASRSHSLRHERRRAVAPGGWGKLERSGRAVSAERGAEAAGEPLCGAREFDPDLLAVELTLVNLSRWFRHGFDGSGASRQTGQCQQPNPC